MPSRRGIQGAALAVADQRQSGDRMRDHAEHRPEAGAVVAFQRDQRAEQEAVGDEGARAVDRIEHPAVARSRLGAVFFADDAVIRIAPLDQRSHRRFGVAVRERDRRGVVLRHDRRARHEIGADRGERSADQLVRERDELALFGARQCRAVAAIDPRRRSGTLGRREERAAGVAVRGSQRLGAAGRRHLVVQSGERRVVPAVLVPLLQTLAQALERGCGCARRTRPGFAAASPTTLAAAASMRLASAGASSSR